MKRFVIPVLILFLFFTGCGGNTAKPENTVCEIEITSLPENPQEGVHVLIDGKDEGTLPVKCDVSEGTHVFIFKSRFFNLRRVIAVNKDTQKIVVNTYTFTVSAESEGNGPYNVEILKDEKLSPFMSEYTIYIDGKFTGKTVPALLKLSRGEHKIVLFGVESEATCLVNVKGDTFLGIKAFTFKESENAPLVLRNPDDIFSMPVGGVAFDSGLNIELGCSKELVSYSGVFAGEKVKLTGVTTHNKFYIRYPSGKIIEVDASGKKPTKYFSKEVSFNELGEYEILDEDKKAVEKFAVLYRAVPIPPTKTVSEIFGPQCGKEFARAVAIPAGEQITIKLLITDANGNVIKNKPIGLYGVKTDENGIAVLKVKGIKDKSFIGKFKVNGKEKTGVIYGDLLGMVYNSLVTDKEGTVLKWDLPEMEPGRKAEIKRVNGHVYLLSDFLVPFGIKKAETKTIDGKLYTDLNTLETLPNTAVFITEGGIEVFKLKEGSYY